MPKTKKRLEKLFRLGVIMAIWGGALGVLMLAWVAWDLPDVTEVKPLNIRPGITILAADDTVITRTGGMKGKTVTLQDLPPYVAHAVLAIEDRRFYDHFGLDLRGLARAMFENVKAGRWVQGGSTITQQLAKNLFLTADKTLRRKGQEALMALSLERKFTKDSILEAYLNRVYFGAGAYGLDAAARTYFGKGAHDLTLWESAVLAGLLKAPSRYSPAAAPDRAAERARVVIAAMHAAGYITEDMMAAELEHAVVTPPQMARPGGAERYFIDWVINRIDSYLTESGGEIVVRTTLIPALQRRADESSRALFARLTPEDKASQMALLTLAKDGAVVAMIGGVDYSQSQFNRATQADRQPGSAFKPFVFLAALESGYSPRDRILDAPFEGGSYRPDNHNGKYYGEVTLEEALVKSLNTATIRLLNSVGIGRMLDVARRAGITADLKHELATGLGSGEVNLLELTGAYAAIGNGGYGVTPYAIESIEDGTGNVLYERIPPAVPRVFAARDVAALDKMLQNVVDQGTARAAWLTRGHAAGKTGTTQNYRDAWFVGYNDSLVTGIWMGNDDNTPMNRVSGGTHPARLWHDYMDGTDGIRVPSFGGNGGAGPGGFSNMLDRWTSGDFSRGGIVPDNRPVYNR